MKLIKYHISPILFILHLSITTTTASIRSAYIYKYNIGAIRTTVTSSTLIWESYTAGDKRQLEFAVSGGKYHAEQEEESYKTYICRALIEGMLAPGTTTHHKNNLVCIVTMLTAPRMHHSFELLVNRGHGAKLVWNSWTKSVANIPVGAVCTSDGHSTDTYIARHKVMKAGHHRGFDYIVGRFDRNILFGKIFVSENDIEVGYEEGELLTEIEPLQYELRDIHIDKERKSVTRNTTLLGNSVLKNLETEKNNIETIISYMYDKEQHWGTLDGMAKGLPTRIVYGKDKLTGKEEFTEINWGLKQSVKTIETKTINTELQPGTALNVTLKANYTITEGPYRATLIAYYVGNSDPVTRKVYGTVTKSEMLDVKIDFSPIYWVHNQTFVPTTTTTTTSTTTTTEPTSTSTSTKEPKPISSPNESFEDDNSISNEITADETRIGEQKIALSSVGGNFNSNNSNKNDKTNNNLGSNSERLMQFNSLLVFGFIFVKLFLV